MSAVPKLKELWARHKDQGLVLIGVHSTMGGEKMAAFVKEQGHHLAGLRRPGEGHADRPSAVTAFRTTT